MRVTYDGRANAAYVYLQDSIAPGEASVTHACRTEGNGSAPGVEIMLDFDVSGRLIGIEVLYASHGLPKELLDRAEVIG
jgi:uncharacterized protein YuzE